ncbi:MAG: cupin domain-containing protein [Armatimonadetes bacterium]|nr:cupin domain-containing protein [Armatimonadota bacterium]
MQKINVRQGKRYAFNTHINEILLPREEAESMEAFYVIIEPGNYTHCHSHSDTEQLYYVISGSGKAVIVSSNGTAEFEMVPEDVVHVPRNTEHQIFCTSAAEPLTYLCVDGFPTGRPADEPTWEDHYKAVVELQKMQECASP